MSESVLPKNKNLIDKKIQEFCDSSAELLTKIHNKYGAMTKAMSGEKSKRGRKKKPKTIEMDDLDLSNTPDEFEDDDL